MTPSLGSAESRNSASNEIVIEVKEFKSKIVLEFPKSIGRRVVRIKKSSLIGREILKISSKGKKLVLTNNKVVFRPSGSIEKTGSKFIIFRPRNKRETMEEKEEKLKLLYNLADRCDNWMANLPEGNKSYGSGSKGCSLKSSFAFLRLKMAAKTRLSDYLLMILQKKSSLSCVR